MDTRLPRRAAVSRSRSFPPTDRRELTYESRCPGRLNRSCAWPGETFGQFHQDGHPNYDDDEIDDRKKRPVSDIRAVSILTEDEGRHRVRRTAGATGRKIDHNV